MHGAGMTNMLFMEGGGFVLEMRNREGPRNNALFALAGACELQYAYLQCKPADEANDKSPNADVICSPAKLDSLLEQLAGRR
jgi:hypothetical protein